MGIAKKNNAQLYQHNGLTPKTRQNGIVVCKIRCHGKVYTEASMVYPKWKVNNICMLHYNIVEIHILLLSVYTLEKCEISLSRKCTV